MKHARAASLTFMAAAVAVLVLIVVLDKGWWDYLLVVLIALLLVGSYEVRRRTRAQAYADGRSRRRPERY